MAGILYLFPDTNLLIQCSPLERLDWEQWKAFDEVHLLITRPVQREIDKHKNGGNDRLGRRGKKAASILREVITGDVDHKIVREAGPRVKLFVRADLKPSEALAETLNYDVPDDQLVGTAHSFMSTNPAHDVRVPTENWVASPITLMSMARSRSMFSSGVRRKALLAVPVAKISPLQGSKPASGFAPHEPRLSAPRLSVFRNRRQLRDKSE